MKLEGKVAVITGAASGIGRAMAKRFSAEGAKLIIADMAEERLAKVHATIQDAGGEATMMLVNVSDRAQAEGMIDAAVENYGQVDILCNNAGVLDGLVPLHEVEDELWSKVMSVNLDGPMYASRKAIQYMLKSGGGAILNTCSAAATNGGRGGAAYTASKHALAGLTKSVAWYYGGQGIRCNALAPGAVQTKMMSNTDFHSEGFQKWQPFIPLIPRYGKAAEVANVALLLCSDEGAFVNGAVVPVDGGWVSY